MQQLLIAAGYHKITVIELFGRGAVHGVVAAQGMVVRQFSCAAHDNLIKLCHGELRPQPIQHAKR